MIKRRFRIDSGGLDNPDFVSEDVDITRYLMRSLRLKPGDSIELFDGSGGARPARLTALTGDRIEANWLGPARQFPPKGPHHLTAVIAHLKGDAEEEAVSALSSAGFGAVRIFEARRGDRLRGHSKRLGRLRRISEDACRQSGGYWLTEASLFADLASAIVGLGALVYGEAGGGALNELPAGLEGVVVGPEGGFGDEELAILAGRGAQAVSLGPRTLRARHAASILPVSIAAMGGVA